MSAEPEQENGAVTLPPPAADREHKPVRYYSECQHSYPDADDDRAAALEDEYNDTHFAVGDGDLLTCEEGFDGYACGYCTDVRGEGEPILWPCEWGDRTLPLPGPVTP